jgi:hypothetical protein
MSYELLSFLIDESKNLLNGVVNCFNLKILNYLYWNYLDYFELNKSIEQFTLINYISILFPIVLYFIIYIYIINILLRFI